MKEVVVLFKRWHLLFFLPRLFLNLRVIASLGCDLLVCKARDPVGDEFVKVLLLERDWVPHLDIIRAVLVELIAVQLILELLIAASPVPLGLPVLLLLPIYVLVVATNIFVGLLEFHLDKVAAGL